MLFLREEDKGNILKIERHQQYHTVDDLVQKSRPSSVYYTFLILSAVIITSGLLLQNTAIVIGGMIITPVITPVLLFSLGISIFEFSAIRRGGLLTVFSSLIILAISWLLAEIFGVSDFGYSLVETTSRYTTLYFFMAVVAGLAGTIAWTRKEASDILPGVAIAISLVPPLALVGIAQSVDQFTISSTYLLIFCLNLFGFIVGSVSVYLLLKFSKVKKEVEKTIRK